jgi:hypothetical protein
LQEQVRHMKLQPLKAAETDHQVLRVFSDSSLVDHTLISRELIVKHRDPWSGVTKRRNAFVLAARR